MKALLPLVIAVSLLSAACVPPGQIKKEAAPGQVQKDTGYNPASGKIKKGKNLY